MLQRRATPPPRTIDGGGCWAEAPISLGMQRRRRQRTHSEIVENENLESFGLGQSKNGCSRACPDKFNRWPVFEAATRD